LFATIHDWLPKDVQLSADRNGGKEQKKELSFDFSEMTTFSAAKGLSMLGGNEMLYVKFLQRFIATHGSNSGGIKELFEKGDLEEMQRYAHTVKGHAGQIGAESLQAVAKKLELSIAEREEALDSHLETFVASMDALCKEIEICLARL
ncbi:MAG: Hpt domain-containing protein, partial [Thermodesulfobacteriota bacterium]|nr:Hpt domain-containing protein [Thermodesulfobacteriota bacterium]